MDGSEGGGEEASGLRHETAAERADRNWEEILQELRVTQSGTQIISGFLLTLAFQQRFQELHRGALAFYLVLVFLAAVSTILGLAPVALHRAKFRRHVKRELVDAASRLLTIELWVVSALTAGVVAFITNFVIGFVPALIAGIVVALIMLGVLLVIPRGVRAVAPRETGPAAR